MDTYADKDSESRVVRQNSDGRRRYDEKGKRALVEAALRPGVSVARLEQKDAINANLLRKWISKYLLEREKGLVPASQDNGADGRELPSAVEVIDGVAIDLPGSLKRIFVTAPPSAFVPVVSAPSLTSPTPPSASMTLALHVRLSNGVELALLHGMTSWSR
ncbi:transposase [Burkholderia sp. RF4-BP95]|uniref:transposase n=1 Tax=Burkholderia sp. RF4-BP95 TaxID=1637845 RepID=UPI00075A9D35|nr:transposase [Burkholderia sp. RF4-BP95]KUY84579.1 transposase [Burkholderia sp. RF4-BP95]